MLFRSGIITRELKIYNTINKSNNDLNFSLLSYGNKEDLKYLTYLENIKLILPFKNLNLSNIYIKFIFLKDIKNPQKFLYTFNSERIS